MDYYTQNPQMLEGQPKRTIGDYVEQNGILVPRRFDSLAEARNSHKAILLRSEHPQEYDGVSGLLDSFQLSRKFWNTGPNRETIRFSPKGINSIDDIKEAYFKFEEITGGTATHKLYCKFLDLDKDEFEQQVSFSIWEELSGLNRTVIADSSIAGRYHVMTLSAEKNNWLINYAIVEDGELAHEFIRPLPEELRKGLRGLIETYEQVRNLGRFDQNHCPIMEFQTHNGKNYFLQYHRARDFSPSEFTLERALQDGEIEVPFVRGATSQDGRDFKVTVYYNKEWYFNPEDEDGSFDLHYNWVFSELQSKRRKLQVIPGDNLTEELKSMVAYHSQRTKMFKPEISTIFPIESVMRDNEILYTFPHFNNGENVPRDPILKNGEKVFDFGDESDKGHNSYINLHFVSDGKKAFVKRI